MRGARTVTILAAVGLTVTAVSCGSATGPAADVTPAAQKAARSAPRRRGFATVEQLRPRRFPHRIWAACDFEARTPVYGWFGATETENIPKYPGNATALRARGPYKKFAALMVGMNPVPGPRMGKVNKMYCRYLLKGATKATFQHFSLSVSDNNNIRVSGLTEGKWSEVTLNFTRDARRNDGTPGVPFKDGERMDDLKIFVGKPGDGKTYEMFIDDVIFFAQDPDLPPEQEPFPRRVIFLAAFDTGIRPVDLPKFWPGEFQVVRQPPAGAYWVAAGGVPAAGGSGVHVLLKMKPDRPAGAETKLRFRYWLSGGSAMKVVLHDATAGTDRVVKITGLKQRRWATRYVNFTKDSRSAEGTGKPLAAGNRLNSLDFVVPAGAGKDVRIYVDEVVLFDAGKPAAK